MSESIAGALDTMYRRFIAILRLMRPCNGVQFLADRRAYATGLRTSVVCDVCIVAKWCVLEQKLLHRDS